MAQNSIPVFLKGRVRLRQIVSAGQREADSSLQAAGCTGLKALNGPKLNAAAGQRDTDESLLIKRGWKCWIQISSTQPWTPRWRWRKNKVFRALRSASLSCAGAHHHTPLYFIPLTPTEAEAAQWNKSVTYLRLGVLLDDWWLIWGNEWGIGFLLRIRGSRLDLKNMF